MNPVQTPLKRIETTHPDNTASDGSVPADVKPNQTGLRGILNSVREAGERVTGGGVRALGKRLFLQSVRRFMVMIMRRPRLLAYTQRLLRPFPRITSRVQFLGALADPLAGQIYIPSGRLSRYSDAIALTLPESARIIYLRLRATVSDTASWDRL